MNTNTFNIASQNVRLICEKLSIQAQTFPLIRDKGTGKIYLIFSFKFYFYFTSLFSIMSTSVPFVMQVISHHIFFVGRQMCQMEDPPKGSVLCVIICIMDVTHACN